MGPHNRLVVPFYKRITSVHPDALPAFMQPAASVRLYTNPTEKLPTGCSLGNWIGFWHPVVGQIVIDKHAQSLGGVKLSRLIQADMSNPGVSGKIMAINESRLFPVVNEVTYRNGRYDPSHGNNFRVLTMPDEENICWGYCPRMNIEHETQGVELWFDTLFFMVYRFALFQERFRETICVREYS